MPAPRGGRGLFQGHWDPVLLLPNRKPPNWVVLASVCLPSGTGSSPLEAADSVTELLQLLESSFPN